MKMSFMYYSLPLLSIYLSFCTSIKTELFERESNQLSSAMKEFMVHIIEKNCQEKDGFLFIVVNKIEPEFSDFATKMLNVNASVIIINFFANKDTKPLVTYFY